MNKVILIGNLTRDVELSSTSSGTSYAKISIAVNRNYTNSEGERETDFINITAWRDLGERCSKYLSKGKKIAVVGSMQTRKYDDKDGNQRYATEVVASEVEFLTPKDDDKNASAPLHASKKGASELQPVNNDDLPF